MSHDAPMIFLSSSRAGALLGHGHLPATRFHDLTHLLNLALTHLHGNGHILWFIMMTGNGSQTKPIHVHQCSKTLFQSIIALCGTDNILHSIPHIHYGYEECPVEYCQ